MKRAGIGRRDLLAVSALLLPCPAIRARAQTAGFALVIGNSKYHWEASLPNVRRDAPDVARRFEALGLQTELVQDADRKEMRRAIDKFRSASRGARFAAFYFAGHGVRLARGQYLVPADADLANPDTVQNLISVGSIRDGTSAALHRILVFDSCRNNPADGWQQEKQMLSAAFTPEQQRVWTEKMPNMLMLFSTAPGRVAVDGPPGQNSPFAQAFMRQFDGDSTDLQALPGKLRRDLLIATRGRQVVTDMNTFVQPFVLGGSGRNRPPAPATGAPGWGSDPSSIIELPNAYALAKQAGIPLPPGLIAHRPPKGSPDGAKIGAFKYDAKSGVGITPKILVIMSVENPRAVEVILAGNDSSGPFWRFNAATLAGNRLEVKPHEKSAHYAFEWRDANSGSLTQTAPNFSGRFTRLDG